MHEAGRFGFKVYFGDGTRLDVLHAAGASEADVVILCIDDPQATDAVVGLVQEHFPGAQLLVRAFDRRHVIALAERGIEHAVRETFAAALDVGALALRAVGRSERESEEIIADIRGRDGARLAAQIEGDVHSARERLFTEPVRPEPLERRPEASS